VPLNLAGLAWATDQSPRWPRVRRWALILGAQVLAVAVLLMPDTEDAARPLWQLVHPVDSRWAAVGHPAMTAFGVALALASVRFALRPRALEAGLLWALVASLLAFDPGGAPLQATLYLATAGLTLSVALIEASHALAYTDELTGLPTRRALNDLLAGLGPRWAVGMVDVDHFKKFNDTYGHQVGDQLLRRVAVALAEVGGGGRPFRYGGEEFAVVFSGLMANQAAPHLETVRRQIAAAAFTVRGRGRRRRKPGKPKPKGAGRKVSVTVSIGVADSTHTGLDPAAVVRAADEALYRAKRAGRNRLAV
jgi:diguanylate cyclase (GGDEF)-like protein